MLTIFNTKHITWIENDTTSLNYYELWADTTDDIPSDVYCFSTEGKGRYKMAQGSLIYIISDGSMYMLNSNDEWKLQIDGSSSGGFEPTAEQLEAMNSGITAEYVNDIQLKLKGLASGTTQGDIITFGQDGYTVTNSGVAIENSTSGISDSDTKIPTSKDVKTNAAGTAVLTGYTAESPVVSDTIVATDTVTQAIAKLDARSRSDENNILLKIGASDYATQNTGGTVRVWTTTDGTDTILHIANEAPTP